MAAVAAAAYVATTVYDGDGPAFGPLTTLGALLVAGCTVATLLTAAVEARDARADTTDALLRLGAPRRPCAPPPRYAPQPCSSCSVRWS